MLTIPDYGMQLVNPRGFFRDWSRPHCRRIHVGNREERAPFTAEHASGASVLCFSDPTTCFPFQPVKWKDVLHLRDGEDAVVPNLNPEMDVVMADFFRIDVKEKDVYALHIELRELKDTQGKSRFHGQSFAFLDYKAFSAASNNPANWAMALLLYGTQYVAIGNVSRLPFYLPIAGTNRSMLDSVAPFATWQSPLTLPLNNVKSHDGDDEDYHAFTSAPFLWYATHDKPPAHRVLPYDLGYKIGLWARLFHLYLRCSTIRANLTVKNASRLIRNRITKPGPLEGYECYEQVDGVFMPYAISVDPPLSLRKLDVSAPLFPTKERKKGLEQLRFILNSSDDDIERAAMFPTAILWATEFFWRCDRQSAWGKTFKITVPPGIPGILSDELLTLAKPNSKSLFPAEYPFAHQEIHGIANAIIHERSRSNPAQRQWNHGSAADVIRRLMHEFKRDGELFFQISMDEQTRLTVDGTSMPITMMGSNPVASISVQLNFSKPIKQYGDSSLIRATIVQTYIALQASNKILGSNTDTELVLTTVIHSDTVASMGPPGNGSRYAVSNVEESLYKALYWLLLVEKEIRNNGCPKFRFGRVPVWSIYREVPEQPELYPAPIGQLFDDMFGRDPQTGEAPRRLHRREDARNPLDRDDDDDGAARPNRTNA